VAQDALKPLRALVDQRAPQPRPRAPLAHVLGAESTPPGADVGEQLAQPAAVLAIGLGAALAAAQRARLHRFGQMRHRPRGNQRVAHEQPAGARLDRDATSRPLNRRTHAPTAAGEDSIRPRLTSPVSVSRASNVICNRCTSNPATIGIRASSAFRQLPSARTISRRAEGGPVHAIFAR
jgi:hypothetical protein